MQHIPERLRAAFGLAGALALAGTIAVVLAYGQGYYDDGYELEAVFPSSSQGLFTDGGSSVKLRGVNVGEVSGVELLDDGRARVKLFIDGDVRVPADALASIEPLSIFGPKFVRIDPGEHEGAGPFLEDGGEITRTQTQRELTDILANATELFEQLDPMDLVVTIDAIAEGTSGMGDEIGRTIDASSTLVDVAARHADDIRQFLGDVALLSDTFATRGDDFLATLGHADQLLDVVTEDPDRIDELLEVTTGISTTFSDLLRDNRAQLDTTIRSVGSFIANVDVEADKIPEFVDMLGTFFGRLADIIRFEGPAGTLMGGLRGFISLDLCYVYGVCPLGGAGAAAPVAGASTGAATVAAARAPRARSEGRRGGKEGV